jgi:hypothetical protein
MQSNGGSQNSSKLIAKARREQRLAEALRANLKRRKSAGSKKVADAASEPKKP